MSDLHMGNVLDERLAVPKGVSPSFTYTPQVARKNDVLSGVAPDKSFWQEHKNFVSGGLLTAGGVLLYLGLRTPGKSVAFNNFIKSRIFEMEMVANRFRMFTNETINSSFSELTKYLDNYRNARVLKPSESVVHIKMLDDPIKIADAQDLAFDAILNMNRHLHKSGVSDVQEFAVKFEKIKSEVSGQIKRSQNQTELELEDYLTLPKAKGHFDADDVESGEIRLMHANTMLREYMSDYGINRLENITRTQFDSMVKAVENFELIQYLTKEKIINTSFDKIRLILGLGKDFVPLYNQKGLYNINPEESAELLKPVKLPKSITSKIEPNIYVNAFIHNDFNRLTEKDINDIFYRISYDNNLKDLKFMIDRFRLREAVAVANKSKDAQIYNIIVTKLEYLSDRLQVFAESELLKSCRKDFKDISIEQRKSQLYYVMRVAKRMGYKTVSDMDKSFAQTSEMYRDLNIRNFVKLFNDNPEIYAV